MNEVKLAYNGFNQVATSWQDHNAAVNTSTTPRLNYSYEAGGSATNSTRLTAVTYPNSRELGYLYSGTDDAASRVISIINASPSQTLASYEYLGVGTVARVDYPEPAIENVLASGGTNPSTGDIYTGLDQFGRVIDCYWRKYSSPTADIERVQYTYDRVGNRLTRQNLVAATTSNNSPEVTATIAEPAPLTASPAHPAKSMKP